MCNTSNLRAHLLGWLAVLAGVLLSGARSSVDHPCAAPRVGERRSRVGRCASVGLASAVWWRAIPVYAGLSVLPLSAWAQTRITDGNIPFLYESRAAVRAPDHRLAAILSKDYRNAEDEFTRHDLLQQIKPVIEDRLSQARQTTQVYMLIGDQLGSYPAEIEGRDVPHGRRDRTGDRGLGQKNRLHARRQDRAVLKEQADSRRARDPMTALNP